MNWGKWASFSLGESAFSLKKKKNSNSQSLFNGVPARLRLKKGKEISFIKSLSPPTLLPTHSFPCSHLPAPGPDILIKLVLNGSKAPRRLHAKKKLFFSALLWVALETYPWNMRNCAQHPTSWGLKGTQATRGHPGSWTWMPRCQLPGCCANRFWKQSQPFLRFGHSLPSFISLQVFACYSPQII